MKNIDYRIIRLEKSYLKENIESFKNILYQTDHQYWESKHFLLDLPGKWDYSYVATIDLFIVGYCICSKKENGVVHIHKFFVDETIRNKDIGQALMRKIKLICLMSGVTEISLNTYVVHREAIHIYEKFLNILFLKQSDDKFGKRWFMQGSIKY